MAFDLSNLPVLKKLRTTIVYGGMNRNISDPTGIGGLSFLVPKPASMLFMLVCGGGSGGGAGLSGLAGTARTGGSGGSVGAMAALFIATTHLPRELFLFPGYAGAGDVTGGGFDAMCSSITDKANAFNITASTILQSGVVTSGAGAFGGNGGAATAASGRASETIATKNQNVYAGSGLWYPSGSNLITGASSGAPGAAGANTFAFGQFGFPLGEGAGGGSLDTSNNPGGGGSYVGAGNVPTIPGGAVAGAVGGDGTAGFRSTFPFWGTGGSGGAAGTTTGGRGGNGAPGCGGGGGGAGVTGGRGGDGGPGFIVISWW